MNKPFNSLTRLIFTLFFVVFIVATSNSQPIVRVHGNTDKFTMKRLILECLNELEVHEDFHLIVRYSENLSRSQPGQTFYQNAQPQSIIWVWIKANLNRKQQRTILIRE